MNKNQDGVAQGSIECIWHASTASVASAASTSVTSEDYSSTAASPAFSLLTVSWTPVVPETSLSSSSALSVDGLWFIERPRARVLGCVVVELVAISVAVGLIILSADCHVGSCQEQSRLKYQNTKSAQWKPLIYELDLISGMYCKVLTNWAFMIEGSIPIPNV